MKRTFTRFVIYSVAILSAQLLVHYLTTKVPNYRHPGRPYLSTLIRMGLIVAVFYPFFLMSRGVMEWFVRVYVDRTKKLTTGWWRGMITCFVLAILLLMAAYAQFWYGRNLFADAWNAIVNLF